MTAYTVSFSTRVDRQFSSLSKDTQQRLYDRALRLATDPRPSGCTKLAGEANTYRVRVGDFRILYEVHDTQLLILVVSIGHRKHVYKQR